MSGSVKSIVIAAAVSVLFSACAKNPFSTRDTQPPLGAGGTWETPHSPEVAVRNLLFSYNEMVISNYQLCFSELFVFSAPEDSIDAVNDGRPDLFAGWDKTAEIGTATNIFSTFSSTDSLSLLLTLSPATPDLVEDSTAILYRNYTLRILSGHGGEVDTLIALGQATFHLAQEQLNWWTIGWWEDKPIQAGLYDWADFKAAYRR
ncbi:MAG: hypothetical protein A2W25_14020 [candidate division Zixibacteria bacterium RBG_16_53_22]|nr:MAG: hypothetical protein A2W25_14020 [candidate division Zixibacteria bacterium RBG_16_53_22]